MVYHLGSMKPRHLFLRILLALSLLVSQQLAMAHLASHLPGSHEESSGKQLAADQFCGTCLTAAQLGSPAADNIGPAPLNACTATAQAFHPANQYLARTACAFQSRAPPL
jgi:hypothetical protein